MDHPHHSWIYGPFHNEVREVLDAVLQGRVLAREGVTDLLDPKTHRIITTLEAVDRFRLPHIPGAEIAGTEWDFMRKFDMETNDHGYEPDSFWKEICPQLDRATALICDRLDLELAGKLPPEAIVEVQSQIDAAQTLRAWRGKCPETLTEQLFQLLLKGWYGCGWEGSPDQGRLVVYCPHRVEEQSQAGHSP